MQLIFSCAGKPHQEFPFLLPVAALGIGGHVGFSDSFDELPLLVCGLWLVPDGFLQLFPPSLLPILLNQLPLCQPLAVIQYHWEGKKNETKHMDTGRHVADCTCAPDHPCQMAEQVLHGGSHWGIFSLWQQTAID